MSSMSNINFTKNNQEVLKSYGEEITQKLGAKKVKQESSWGFGWISGYFTTTTAEKLGYTVGESIGWAHGAQVSNFAVDIVVSQFFKAPEPVSKWSWEAFKRAISGVAEVSIAETAKLTITPKVLPVISVMAGTVGSIALPAAICMISQIYSRVMTAEESNELAQLSIGELFSVDPETGRFRDAFGVLLSEQDMKDVVNVTTQYDLVYNLSEALKQIDAIMGVNLQTVTAEELHSLIKSSGLDLQSLIEDPSGFANLQKAQENKATAIIDTLLDVYKVSVGDEGEIIFVDGSIMGEKEKAEIDEGIRVLLRSNPTHDEKRIKKLIKVVAKHASLPFETLSVQDKVQMVEEGKIRKAKRMPEVFKGENEWKNGIIRTETGKYVLIRDSGDRAKGTIISDDEMNTILDELDTIQKEKILEKKSSLNGLINQPKKRTELANKLNIEKTKEIQEFFKSFVVEKEDGTALYLNGKVMSKEEHDRFKLSLFELNLQNGRKNRILNLINLVNANFPQEKELAAIGISYENGKFSNDDGEFTKEEVAFLLNQHETLFYS